VYIDVAEDAPVWQQVLKPLTDAEDTFKSEIANETTEEDARRAQPQTAENPQSSDDLAIPEFLRRGPVS
jgi:hypothetical protein